MRELKRERESEQTRARTHKLDRTTAALEHPTDGKLCWSGGGNQRIDSQGASRFCQLAKQRRAN